MAPSEQEETTDVLICGCGPTGAMLSVLLSQMNVSHVILEKESDITTDPRGIALDEDGVRCLQACGVYSEVFTDIGQCMGNFNFVGGTEKSLATKPFMSMDYNTTEGGTGHPGFICHKQPKIEKHLRSKIAQLGVGDLRSSCRIISINEDKDWVYAKYVNANNEEKAIRARFLVGADGKTGFTRKQYLEPRGITLNQARTMPYDECWVAMNWEITLPSPESHPEFPLWAQGFTPQQVYDSFFPQEFRFLCNPRRPAVCGRFGLEQDHLWRFEFVVLPDEDPSEMASPEKIREVVYPYVTHPGSRYGLRGSIQYPEDCIKVLRCRPFQFAARSCNKWALGRVILSGDAAHVFPPFGGQGIASGFRDACGLAWRLKIATGPHQKAMNYDKLLEGWYKERKQQLDKSLDSTIENGAYVTEGNPLRIFLRDWYLWLLQLVPSWKHWLQLGNRREGMTRYRWEDGRGMAFMKDMAGGQNFVQVYAVQLKADGLKQSVSFTDDIIFAPRKQATFQLVVILQSPVDIVGLETELKDLDQISEKALLPEETSVFINSTKVSSMDTDGWDVWRLASAGEFAQTLLCKGRPEPKNYDPYRMSKEVEGLKFVILRPDRFVFAACNNRTQLRQAAQKLGQLTKYGSL